MKYCWRKKIFFDRIASCARDYRSDRGVESRVLSRLVYPICDPLRQTGFRCGRRTPLATPFFSLFSPVATWMMMIWWSFSRLWRPLILEKTCDVLYLKRYHDWRVLRWTFSWRCVIRQRKNVAMNEETCDHWISYPLRRKSRFYRN